MGLIPEIDQMDYDIKHGALKICRKSTTQLYVEFAESYCKQGHTCTEAWQLICDDLRRRNPRVFDEEFLASLIEDAKIEDARKNAQNKS